MTTSDAGAPALTLLDAGRPLIIGHRGYPQFAPENTLPSFRLAIEAGADFVELDYCLSRDGVPVVMHDDTLDRTTDASERWGRANIPVVAHTAAEMGTLDAGSWFAAGYKGTRLPVLAEAVDWIQGLGGMTLIERKEGGADDCVRLLRDKRLVNRLVVQSFDWKFVKHCHDLEPSQVLGALGPPTHLPDGRTPAEIAAPLSAEWLDALVKTGARLAVWNDEVSRESVALAHARGLGVWIYTVNDPDLANALLDMGVDGLITNNTGLMWRTLALRGTSRA